jgi:hypothetical protein
MNELDETTQQLCRCGKWGWGARGGADRTHRQMRGRDKSPRRDQLNVYQCVRTDSGLWHVGHDRRGAKS